MANLQLIIQFLLLLIKFETSLFYLAQIFAFSVGFRCDWCQEFKGDS